MAVDINKWLNDNLNALNLSDEDKALATKLATGEFGKRLGSAVYPQQSVSDLQSRLDQEANAKRELEAANIAWQDQYYRDVSELGAIDKLAAVGFDVTGLQPTRTGGARDTATGQTMTAAEIQKLVQLEAQKLIEPVRASNLEYTDFVTDVAPEYKELTGKRFDSKAFRDYAFEGHKNGKFSSLPEAFREYTAEARTKKAEADRTQWEKDKEKEIEMRVMSRMQIPEYAPESGVGGPFDIAKNGPAATATAAVPTPASREENRQAFAKKFQDVNLSGL